MNRKQRKAKTAGKKAAEKATKETKEARPMTKEKSRSRFRAGVARGVSGKINRDENIIEGFAVVSKGMAEGHGVEIDDTTLGQVVELGNAREQGIKSRFGHPNMSSEALGTFLGRAKRFRRDGDVVRADLHIDETAFSTPNGDLGTYVLKLAESDPEAFGASIVFAGTYEQRLNPDGTAQKDDDGEELPPLARVEELYAVDAVDKPAANTGLFSGTSAQFSAEMTEFLDNFLGQPEAVEKAISFLERYRANADHKGQKVASGDQSQPPTQEVSTMPNDGKKDTTEATFTKADLDTAVKKAVEGATASAFEKYQAQSEAKVKADRERCTAIDQAAKKLGTKPELVAQAKSEGWSTSDAMVKFIDAFEAKKTAALGELTTDPGVGVKADGTTSGGSAESSFDEEKSEFDAGAWEKAWEEDAALRKRWSDQKKEFIAYGKNKGKVRVKLER